MGVTPYLTSGRLGSTRLCHPVQKDFAVQVVQVVTQLVDLVVHLIDLFKHPWIQWTYIMGHGNIHDVTAAFGAQLFETHICK